MRKNNILKIVVVGFLVLAMVATSLLPAFAANSPTHGKVVKTYTKKLVKDAKSNNRYAIYKKGTAHLKSLQVGKKKTATVPTTMTYKDVTYQVTCIRGNAFTKSKKLKHLKIRKNITSINKNAFKGSSITKITFTDKKIANLKKGAFNRCKVKKICFSRKFSKKEKKRIKKAFRKSGYKGKISF